MDQNIKKTHPPAFKELVITLKDQIEIMKAWKASGFREPLDSIVLREFFHNRYLHGRMGGFQTPGRGGG